MHKEEGTSKNLFFNLEATQRQFSQDQKKDEAEFQTMIDQLTVAQRQFDAE